MACQDPIIDPSTGDYIPQPDRYYVSGPHLMCLRIPVMMAEGYHWPILFIWVEEHDKPWPWWHWKLVEDSDYDRPPATCWPIDAKPNLWV